MAALVWLVVSRIAMDSNILRLLVLSLVAAGAGCVRYEPRPLVPLAGIEALESRSLTSDSFHRFLSTNAPAVAAKWPMASWDFEALAWAAFYYHASLDLARAQWNTLQAGVLTAGGRPNPTLIASPGYNFSAANGVSPWFPGLTIDVPIETAGKRGHRRARAEQVSEAARWNIASTAWQVRTAVRAAMIDLAAATQRLELLAEQERIQGELTGLLERRLAGGTADATEVTQSRMARQRTEVDLAAARRVAALARVRLAESIGVPARALDGLDIDGRLGAFVLPATLEESDLARARQAALQGRADVMSALADYAGAESALHLEIAKQYPDLRFSPGYQWDQGDHKWSLGLAVELPVLNRNRGPIAEALAKRDESAARFNSLQARILSEIDLAFTNQALATAELRRAGQWLEAQQSADRQAAARLQAGAADRLERRAASLELAVARLALLDVQVRAAQAGAQVEDALQRPIAGLSTLERDPRAPPSRTHP